MMADNDGALAILHGRAEPAATLIIREIGEAAPHHVGGTAIMALLVPLTCRSPAG
jgi:hypothetical protein